MPRITVVCEGCGKSFEKPRSLASNRKHHFCCHRCYGDWMKGRKGAETSHWQGGLVETKCATCGTVVQKRRARIQEFERHFCGRPCQDKWRSANMSGANSSGWRGGPETRSCGVCGKAFEAFPHSPQKFCSKECGGVGRVRQIERTCKHCSNSFKVWESATKYRKAEFCSNECFTSWNSGDQHFNWRGGLVHDNPGYRGPNWTRQKRAARKRDGYKCQYCGKHESELDHALDVHHIAPFRDFGLERYKEANRLSNLVSLCRSCHMRAEHGKIDLQ